MPRSTTKARWPRAAEGRVDGRPHHDPVGAARVRGEGLLAVEDPVVAVAPRAGADRRDVGAGARLGHREGAPARPVGLAERAEEALLLLRRSHREHRRLAEPGPGERDRDAAVPVGQLLGEADARRARSPRAPARRARASRRRRRASACGRGRASDELRVERDARRAPGAPSAVRLEAERAGSRRGRARGCPRGAARWRRRSGSPRRVRPSLPRASARAGGRSRRARGPASSRAASTPPASSPSARASRIHFSTG